MSVTETEAAAALTNSILGQLAGDGYDKAAELLQANEPAVQPVVAAPPVPSSPPAVADATEPVAEPEALPSFEPDVPEDLQALIDEPDFDEEAAAEVAARLETAPDEYLDVEATTADLSKDKRIAFLEAQLVAKSRKNWIAENLRAYPLLRTYAKDEVEKFTATSRRAFAREAAALNGRLETIAKPMLQDIAALKEGMKGEAIAEGKQEAKKRWGDAPGDVAGTGSAQDHAAELAAAEKTGKLRDIFKVMLKHNPDSLR